jgi:Fe-S cluster assembly ATP-binding protein
MLKIDNLRVKADKKIILNGVNLQLKPQELVALMGPNGSGKSTLAYVLAGHPGYEISGGKISLNGQDMGQLPADKRAQLGLFLAFQYPVAVTGVDLRNFLRQAYGSIKKKNLPPFEFRELLKRQVKSLGLEEAFLSRSINDGFSGGEKKKSEILQLAVLRPQYAILDEIDSGLDIDAVKVAARAIGLVRRDNPCLGLLLITHYRRILDFLKVDRVAVMKAGRIVKEGSRSLINQLEAGGYAGL